MLPGTTTLRYMQYFGALQRGTRKINLYRLKDADSRSYGKPPPESFDRITKTEFASQVQTWKPGFGGTCLISDGAPAYLKLCPRMNLLHRACCHSNGQFVVQSRFHGQKLSMHTGGIDSAWKLCKAAVPSSVGTKTADGFNAKIDPYFRSWQWRWKNALCPDLLKKTAQFYMHNDH